MTIVAGFAGGGDGGRVGREEADFLTTLFEYTLFQAMRTKDCRVVVVDNCSRFRRCKTENLRTGPRPVIGLTAAFAEFVGGNCFRVDSRARDAKMLTKVLTTERRKLGKVVQCIFEFWQGRKERIRPRRTLDGGCG